MDLRTWATERASGGISTLAPWSTSTLAATLIVAEERAVRDYLKFLYHRQYAEDVPEYGLAWSSSSSSFELMELTPIWSFVSLTHSFQKQKRAITICGWEQ